MPPGAQPSLLPAEPPATGDDEQDFDAFIYLISHDVRNSVRALMEIPQWIEEDLIEAGHRPVGSLRENLQLLNQQARRLDRMLHDLLVYSRIGRMQVVRQVDLEEAIDNVLSQVAVPRAFGITRDLQQRRLTMGDRDVLTLLAALVGNAIRHHGKPEGRIDIRSNVEGDQVVLRVADDGPGIPEAWRDRAFEAMKTLRPRDEVEGSGMGLAHVRKIAALHGGTARIVDPPAGTGTCVEVRLPRHETLH